MLKVMSTAGFKAALSELPIFDHCRLVLDMLSLNFFLERDPLSLDAIRSVLTRLEDTIIFGLIERAQFAHNAKIYAKGGIPELEQKGFQGSWLEWFLKEIETFHGSCVLFVTFVGVTQPVLYFFYICTASI